MVVGIVINNVIRDHISALSRVYTKYTGNDPIEPINPYDLDKSFPIEKKEEDEDPVSVQYFIHVEAPFEILGAAEETVKGIVQRLNTLQDEIDDDIVLLNRDSLRGRAATLFFLSKTNFGLGKVIFPPTYEACWDDVDMIITDHPDIIACKPKNKILIKLIGHYNQEYASDFTIEKPEEIFDRKAEFFTIKKQNE